MSGHPITDENGKQLKYDSYETAMKVLGFNPLRVSKRHEARSDAYELQEYWRGKKTGLYAAYRMAETPQERLKVKRRILEFNGKLKRSQAAGLVPPITSKSLKQAEKVRSNRRQADFMDRKLS
ncbi:MAG: hypothetical protein EOM24_12495 [Chloroflexia bacterium]|nr:hypothetical protein [Chloroflexia bacterium]